MEIRKEKKKRHLDGKRKIKLNLFADGRVLQMKNSKESKHTKMINLISSAKLKDTR